MPGSSRRRSAWLVAALSTLTAAALVVAGSPATAQTTEQKLPYTAAASKDPDAKATTVGTKFTVAKAGKIVGVEFFRVDNQNQASTVQLWGSGSTALATASGAPSGNGWVRKDFAAPVSVAPGTTYIASYFAPTGKYSHRLHGWDAARTAGDLAAPVSAGLYRYASSAAKPTTLYENEDYYVTPVFVADVVAPPTSTAPPPTSTTTAPPPTSTTAPPPPPGGFPDASNTGVPAGTTLQAVPGQVTSGAGWRWENDHVVIDGVAPVLDSLDINGCVSIFTNNVTIKRSKVHCGSYYVIKNFDPPTHFTGLLVEDVELDGMGSLSGSTGVAFQNYTARRVNAHALSSLAFKVEDNVTVEDSFIHDFACGYADNNQANGILHQAGLGTNGGSAHMVIRHNTIDLPPVLVNGEGCISGGIANYMDFGTSNDLTVDGNRIDAGGGYCLKAGVTQPGSGFPNATNVHVTNNVFGRKYFAECGQFGPASNYAAGTGNAWTGNTWGDGAAATASHAVGDPVLP